MMKFSRQTFDGRRGNVAAIVLKIVAKLFANWFKTFTALAGALLYRSYNFTTQFDDAFDTSLYRDHQELATTTTAPLDFSLRGTNGGPRDTARADSPASKFDAQIDVEQPMSSNTDIATSHKKKFLPPEDSSFIAFYNLFIPDEAESAANAVEVLTEQLGQVAESLRRLENSHGNEKTTSQTAMVYYNLIGNAHICPEEHITSLCKRLHPGLTCQLLNFYESASEAATLRDVYQYCQDDDDAYVQRTNNDTRVVYLHSKGSYHSRRANDNWRREMTNSVFHQDCLFPPDDKCDVCGAQFYTRFSFMFPGNMWTAKCSYIRKLLSPVEGGEYERLKRESVLKFFKLRLWGHLDSTLLDDRVDYYGLGRYRLEHWVASHPSIQPCELHKKNVTFENMTQGKVNPDYDYEWSVGEPRQNVIPEIVDEQRKLARSNEAQFREYFFMPGNLIKWFSLYGKEGIPAQDSWVWNFIPAGSRWKWWVKEHGENAIDEMVKQSSSHRNHSAFDKGNSENKHYNFDHDEKLLSDPSDPVVVFHHITFPEGEANKAHTALRSQFHVLSNGEYNNVTLHHNEDSPVILYYSVSGGTSSNLEFLSNLCESHAPKVTCKRLGRFESPHANGETLQQLHRFCQSNPTTKVSYLTNMLPTENEADKTEMHPIEKTTAYTTAATSRMCLTSRDNCNVCGMEFYPLPFHHFVGNMFAASCDYVKDLMPPDEFEVAMHDIVDDVLVKKVEGVYTAELSRFTPRNLGLDQYSIEHWIGSHPDFRPCDVAPVPTYTPTSTRNQAYSPVLVPNEYSSKDVYDFSWGLAPRRKSTPPYTSTFSERKEVITQNRLRYIFREYSYLAGNLHRWYRLYKKAPSTKSWVWQWYPKGDEWRRGAITHGSDVVEKLSAPFVEDGFAL
mmetsp:Transcript_28003/g.58862  ORF Transcript_28003/g.58862 Transcript_28003/m.58862 type:complete len:898 (-) Transcript_28003:127-2820(-)